MSAVLLADDVDSVISDMELLKSIRRSMTELRDSEVRHDERLSLTIGSVEGDIATVYGSAFLFQLALQAIEREVTNRLKSKDIEVKA